MAFWSRPVGWRLLAAFAVVFAGLAQVQTGTVAGVVADPSGAVIPGARITVTNSETGLSRSLITSAEGTYSAPGLPAGTYEVKAEAPGFRVLVRPARVETGSTTTVNMEMQVGATSDVVTVQEDAARIDYESHAIDGVVTRRQIESLPLNGRSFLQLAFLEPGITVTPGSTAQYNSQFSVSVLGGRSASTNVTVDGGSVRNSLEGDTQQNFSQEVVEEFQISTVNFDLSTPITSVGSINIVTRSGGNDFHGSAYFFFRDHNMSAYPQLGRDPLNPDPFFARSQAGFYVGGPIRKDRLFFFTNYEHNNQRGVFTVQPDSPLFAAFSQIAPSPYTANQFSQRFDARLTPKHSLFLRYSHDGNHGFGPKGGATLPSNWLVNTNWADQGVLGVISAFTPALVNDFRSTFGYWSNRNLFPGQADCPNCAGLGFPEVHIIGTNIVLGNTQNATQGRNVRRFSFADNVTWQKGAHRLRWGGEFCYEPGRGFWGFADPAVVYVWGPNLVAYANSRLPAGLQVPIPSHFSSIQDILQLPLYTATFGIGDPSQPPPFHLGNADHNDRVHLYFQDTWRVRPRFNVNYGIGWQFENNLVNHDLSKPALLQPILGASGLAPTRQRPFNFSPALGFAWNVSRDNKTVVRAGIGIYYDTIDLYWRLQERGELGPLGNGRLPLPSTLVPNPIPGIPGVAVGTPLDFRSIPTGFTLGNLMAIMTPVRQGLERQLANPAPDSLAVRTIDVFKTGDDLMPPDYPILYSEQLNVGVQREITNDLTVSADFVMRRFFHSEIGPIDYNHFNAAQGPLIPACSPAQATNPAALCSNGALSFWTPGGMTRYKGLLVRVNRRFSGRYQFLASYAYQSQWGINGIQDLNNWFSSWGPQNGRHILNLSGVVSLPLGFQASFISRIQTRAPAMPIISGVDLGGSGVDNTPLPGAAYNQFGRALGPSDLRRLVDQFNQQYAGRKTSRGQNIPSLALPGSYSFGDNFYSQDLRLSKIFRIGERYRLTVFGEAFNLFNIANLSGYGFDLTNTAGFGQPTSRIGQIFGSGGPRAFQVGARANF